MYDGGYFRVFAVQYVANISSNRFPCWEATTEPVYQEDNGDFVVHERNFAIGADGSRTLLKANMVGFALAEYSKGTFPPPNPNRNPKPDPYPYPCPYPKPNPTCTPYLTLFLKVMTPILFVDLCR